MNGTTGESVVRFDRTTRKVAGLAVIRACFLAACIAPVRFWVPVGPFGTFTILELALGFLGLAALLRRSHDPVGIRLIIYASGVPLAAAVLSFVWTDDILATQKAAINAATAAFAFLVPYRLYKNAEPRVIGRAAVWFVCASSGLAAAYWFWPEVFWSSQGATADDLLVLAAHEYAAIFARLDSPFLGRSNDFATTLALYVVLFGGLHRANGRRMYAFGGAVAALAMTLTLSRGVIAVAVAAVMWSSARRITVRRAAAILVVIAAILVVASRFITVVESTGVSILDDRLHNAVNVADRWDRLQVAIGIVAENPLVGLGGGRYMNKDVSAIDSAFHNTYVEQLAAYGLLLGTLVIVSFGVAPSVLWGWRRANGEAATVARAATYATLAYWAIASHQTSNEASVTAQMYRVFVGLVCAYIVSSVSRQASTCAESRPTNGSRA